MAVRGESRLTPAEPIWQFDTRGVAHPLISPRPTRPLDFLIQLQGGLGGAKRIHLTYKELAESVGKGTQIMKVGRVNLLSLILKRTDQICYCGPLATHQHPMASRYAPTPNG